MTIAPPDTGYARMMATALAPMVNPCPKCPAGRGWYCRSTGGYQNSTVRFHAARRKLIDGWSDDRRAAAFAELRAELGHQVSAPLVGGGAR